MILNLKWFSVDVIAFSRIITSRSYAYDIACTVHVSRPQWKSSIKITGGIARAHMYGARPIRIKLICISGISENKTKLLFNLSPNARHFILHHSDDTYYYFSSLEIIMKKQKSFRREFKNNFLKKMKKSNVGIRYAYAACIRTVMNVMIHITRNDFSTCEDERKRVQFVMSAEYQCYHHI